MAATPSFGWSSVNGSPAAAALSTFALSAFDCAAPYTAVAPHRPSLGDALDSSEGEAALQIADLDRLDAALRTLHYRGGSGIRIECIGNDPGTLRPVSWLFRLEQLERVDPLAAEPTLTAFENRYRVHDAVDARRVAGVLVAEAITLPERSRWRVGPDRESLHATTITRRAGSACASTTTGRCSLNVTIDWHLGGSRRHPELVQVRHVNGRPSDIVHWRLDE